MTNMLTLIQNCSVRIDPNSPTAAQERSLQREQMLKILSNMKDLVQSDFNILKQLFDMVCTHIIRKIDEMSNEILYSDSKISVDANNWDTISIAHQILSIIIENVNPNILMRFIGKDFIDSLMHLLVSTDPNERTSVDSQIFKIFDCLPKLRSCIYHGYMKQIENYYHNYKYYLAVSSALNFISTYITTVADIHSYFPLFKTKIFPLMATPFLAEFYTPLNNLSAYFESKSSEIAEFCLDYLLKHWPITDSTKQAAFLNHLIPISSGLEITAVPNIIPNLFSRINKCLRSDNFKVVSASLMLLSDQTFLFIFGPFMDLFLPIIIHSLESSSRHWNQEVVRLSNVSIKILFSRNMDLVKKIISQPNFVHPPPPKDNSATWEIILQSAHHNHPEKDFIFNDLKDYHFVKSENKNTSTEVSNDHENAQISENLNSNTDSPNTDCSNNNDSINSNDAENCT